DVQCVSDWRALVDQLGTLEPSDTVCLIDPRFFPVERFDVERFRSMASHDARWAIHLVAFEGGVGTRELVNFDSAGRVRRIQRYYTSVTWPFMSGVAASILSVSPVVLGDGVQPASLWELRSRLADTGVPSSDVSLVAGTHDLSSEAGFLAASEHFIREATT